MEQSDKNVLTVLIANEERKKDKKIILWSDEELLDFIISNNVKDYKNEVLKLIKKIRKEIVTVTNIKNKKFTLGNEYINQLEKKGFVVVYEIPEITRNKTINDSGIINYVGEKVCTKGTILLHPEKSIYLVLEHIIYENENEELNHVKGCMVIDKNECSEELKKAANCPIFWGFFIDEIDDNKLMISFHGDTFYYCSSIIDTFFEKVYIFTLYNRQFV